MSDRTKEEIEADIAVKLAEARKSDAEARKLEAEGESAELYLEKAKFDIDN